MFFLRLLSLVMEIAAIIGVFVEIPLVSNFAFWIMVAAYLLWIGINKMGDKGDRLKLMLTIVLTTAQLWGSSSEYQSSATMHFG